LLKSGLFDLLVVAQDDLFRECEQPTLVLVMLLLELPIFGIPQQGITLRRLVKRHRHLRTACKVRPFMTFPVTRCTGSRLPEATLSCGCPPFQDCRRASVTAHARAPRRLPPDPCSRPVD